MIENWFSIPASDNKRIYFILNQNSEVKAERAIVIAHGLTGHPAEHIHQVATKYFLSKGYDVYRIGFYGDPEDARKLPECTLELHSSDLNTLISHVSKSHARIFVAGHSYGGLTTLISNPDVAALAFWDSSYVPEFWDQAFYIPETDNYIIGWGVYSVIGKAMVEEGRKYTREYSKSLAAKVKITSAVMLAGKGQENADRTGLYDDLLCPKQLTIFENASHTFWETDQAEQLARATEEFFSAS